LASTIGPWCWPSLPLVSRANVDAERQTRAIDLASHGLVVRVEYDGSVSVRAAHMRLPSERCDLLACACMCCNDPVQKMSHAETEHRHAGDDVAAFAYSELHIGDSLLISPISHRGQFSANLSPVPPQESLRRSPAAPDYPARFSRPRSPSLCCSPPPTPKIERRLRQGERWWRVIKIACCTSYAAPSPILRPVFGFRAIQPITKPSGSKILAK
jgi:hypothetical protein